MALGASDKATPRSGRHGEQGPRSLLSSSSLQSDAVGVLRSLGHYKSGSGSALSHAARDRGSDGGANRLRAIRMPALKGERVGAVPNRTRSAGGAVAAAAGLTEKTS